MNRYTQVGDILHELDNRMNHIEFQGQRSNVKVMFCSPNCFHRARKKL